MTTEGYFGDGGTRRMQNPGVEDSVAVWGGKYTYRKSLRQGGQNSAACRAARCGDAAAKRVSAESGEVEVDRDSFPLSRLQAQGGGCSQEDPTYSLPDFSCTY